MTAAAQVPGVATVVVSGAGSGIGAAVAHAFEASGATVVGMDVQAGTANSSQLFLQGDVREPADWQRLSALVDKHGGLSALVNCAGIGFTKSLEETSFDDWERALSTNLTGTFLGIRSLLGPLKVGKGAVVNVASTLGLVGGANLSAYCASKGGVVNLTRALAAELGGSGIRVNCVCPGPIDTPFIRRDSAPFGDIAGLADRTVLGRLGTPEEVADLVVFLASAKARFITGAVIAVDGGRLTQ